MAVVPSLSDIHGYDQSVFSIRRYLRVVTRRKTAAGLLHHTRLGITCARACLAFFFRRLLRLAQLFQFRQSLFQPFSLFSRCSLPRRLLAADPPPGPPAGLATPPPAVVLAPHVPAESSRDETSYRSPELESSSRLASLLPE